MTTVGIKILFDQPHGWEAEVVSMDGAIYLRAKAPGSRLPWQYVLSVGEANAMAQALQEAAIEAHQQQNIV